MSKCTCHNVIVTMIRILRLLLDSLIRRFEKAIIANAKQNVTLDVLSYHASASLEDAQKLRVNQSILSLI